MRIEDRLFQVLEVVVIQIEVPLESLVGHPSMALQQRDHLFDHGIKIHQLLHLCQRRLGLGSQNVISMARYSMMVTDSSVRAGS